MKSSKTSRAASGAESALREQAELDRARLAAIVESSEDAVIGKTLDGTITSWNAAAERLYGYTAEEAVGRHISLIIPEDLRPQLDHIHDKLSRGERVEHLETQRVRRDGTRIDVSVSVSPIKDPSGRVVGGATIARDITERRRAERALRESMELNRAVMDSQAAHIAVLDRDGRIVAVNDAWRRFSAGNEGLPPSTDVGADYLSACLRAAAEGGDDTTARAVVEGIRAVLEGDLPSFTVEYPCHSPGEQRWFLLHVSPLPEGRGGAVVSHINITERKLAEETLTRRARQAALGADVGVALAESGASLRKVLGRCAESVVRNLDAAFARIWTLNRDENVLELQASAGMYTHTDGPHGRVPVGRFKIGLIAEERRPHLTNSVVGDPRVGDQEWARGEGMVSFAGYPLVVEDRLVGVLAMFARHALTDDALDALSSVANTIAQGIERKRAEEALAALLREREQTIEEVSTPVVPVLEGVLVLPLIGSLDRERMERATRAALTEVTRQGARACIVDITAARIADSAAVANLTNLVQSLRLVGAEGIVTGVGAQAARGLVGLGLDLKGLRTYRTLAQALAALMK